MIKSVFSKSIFSIAMINRPQNKMKKWDKIINTFMERRIDELKRMYKNGTRERIFELLVK